MASSGTQSRERMPRRGRYLIPKEIPNRAEILAGIYLVLLIAHLVAAQLAALLAVVLYGANRLARLRGGWLALPLLVGLGWTAIIGPSYALQQHFVAGRQILGYASGAILHLGDSPAAAMVFGQWPAWVSQQLPVALVIASGEALFVAWLTWLHTDEVNRPRSRPGLLWALRRWRTVRAVRGGGVVTKDGVCLGVDEATGGPVRLSWREVSGNLLCVGGSDSGKTTTSLQLVYAALRRRKPVIGLDISGDAELVSRFRRACGDAGVPCYVFTSTGPCRYDPLSSGSAERRTDLVMSLVDWRGTPEQYRRSSVRYVTDVFAVLDAASGSDDGAVLDDLVRLTDPDALLARAECIPSYHPHREALLERVRVSTSLVRTDPQTLSLLTGALRELHASPLGRWLGHGQDGGDEYVHTGDASLIDVERVLRDRAAVLFSLDATGYGRAATSIAALVTRDVVGAAAELRAVGVAADGLVWLDEFGPLPEETLHDLLAGGRDAGLPVLASTRYGQQASATSMSGQVVDLVGAYLLHRVNDPDGAEAVARLGGEIDVVEEHGRGASLVRAQPAGAQATARQKQQGQQGRKGPVRSASTSAHAGADGVASPAATAVPQRSRRPLIDASAVQRLADGHFTLMVKTPQHRLVRRARTVPARALDPGHGEHPAQPFGAGSAGGR